MLFREALLNSTAESNKALAWAMSKKTVLIQTSATISHYCASSDTILRLRIKSKDTETWKQEDGDFEKVKIVSLKRQTIF